MLPPAASSNSAPLSVLNGEFGGIKAVSAEVIKAKSYELGRVEGGELIGVTDESSGGEDVFDSIFEFGQDTADDLRVDVGDIIEILDGLKEGETIVGNGAFLLKSDVLREKMGAGCAD